MTLEEMKKIRIDQNFSCREIAELSNVPPGTVRKIFTGETDNPRFNTLEKLNEFFVGISLKYLNEMPENPSFVHDSHGYIPPDSSAEELDYFELTLGKRQGEFTVADRDALPDDIRTELIDGYIYYLAAPNRKHQLIAGIIHADLLTFAFDNDRGCLPQIAPVDVNLDDDDRTMLQPDVLVLCHEDRDDRYVHGAPEFVVEIISKSSRKKDTIIKLNKYMRAGVREYWIVDPRDRNVTVILNEEEGPAIRGYTFGDRIPVGIWNGECMVDFAAIMEHIGFLFDLDGTLLDTLEDLAASVNHVMRTYREPEHSTDAIRKMVGNGVRKLMERAIPGGEACPTFAEQMALQKEYYLFIVDIYATKSLAEFAYELGHSIIMDSGISKEIYSSTNPEDLSRQENLEEFLGGMQDFVESRREEGLEREPR